MSEDKCNAMACCGNTTTPDPHLFQVSQECATHDEGVIKKDQPFTELHITQEVQVVGANVDKLPAAAQDDLVDNIVPAFRSNGTGKSNGEKSTIKLGEESFPEDYRNDLQRETTNVTVNTSHTWKSEFESFEKLRSHDLEEVDIKSLKHLVNKRKKFWENDEPNNHGAHGHGHGHSKPPSIVSAAISGFINYLLMFGLCCAYGMIMFSDDFNQVHRALGVKLNLLTSLILGLALAWKSKVAVAIGGPDLNPVVFLGGFVGTMSEAIAENVGLLEIYPESSSRRLMEESPFESFRRLGGGSGGASSTFCDSAGQDYSNYASACEEYHARLRATAIFATAVTSALLGMIYYLLGRFKVTRLVNYVPTSVQEAFLSCIGYKVFKYALTFCNYTPMQFIPAACIGVTLYFCKSKHLGNPAIVIPSMVLAPLALFYIIVAIAGLDIEDMRTTGKANNWMFPKLAAVPFWELWTDSYGKADQIDFKAWAKTLPDLGIMIIVCLIDCLLKISSTESKLPVKVDKDYEAKLYGLCNVFTTLTGSSVGYMQLKFNVINYGVLGNVTDRRGGVIYALLCGACFFGTIMHFNYLPRFFLGVLLFFAGAGFVAENLWGSRKHLSLLEWGEILVILAVFIFSGSLVAAVVVGVLVTCVSLILKYTKVSCISGHPIQGGHITASMERRNPLLMGQLSHIADSWFVVVRLKGYIFFASAQRMTAKIAKLIDEKKDLDHYRQYKYVVLDCEMLDGMDASAGKSIRKLLSDCQTIGIKLFWSSVDRQLKKTLMDKEMIADPSFAFETLNEAVLFIEDAIIEYQKSIQRQFLGADCMFKLQHNLARFEDDQDPWGSVLLKMTSRRGCPWQYCNKLDLVKCTTVLWTPGELHRGLYLIHCGKVALYPYAPTDGQKWPSPVAIYGHGWFMNRDFILGKPTQYWAVAIESGEAICWTRQQWWKMFTQRPVMASEIMKAVYSQHSVDLGSAKWLAEVATEDPDPDAGLEEVQELVDITDEGVATGAMSEAVSAVAYDDLHRALLPPQLKELINALEMAEAFGRYGAYEFSDDDHGDLPPIPDSLRRDLEIAFDTHSTVEDGVKVLPSHSAMPALAYAGIPRVAVKHSARSHFTQDEFICLGHSGAMLRLTPSVSSKLRECVAEHRKKHSWRDGLDPHQFAHMLNTAFHHSLTADLVQDLMEDSLPEHSDEDVFLSMCSLLFRWHEQYWYLLVAIRQAAGSGGENNINSNAISYRALAKLLLDNHQLPEQQLGSNGLSAEELQRLAEVKASELLWASDWPRRYATDGMWGKRLHIFDLALCVLCQVSAPGGNLHPTPSRGGLRAAKHSKSKGSSQSGSKKWDMSSLIVHLPALKAHHPEFKLLFHRMATERDSKLSTETPKIEDFEPQRQASPGSAASHDSSGISSASSKISPGANASFTNLSQAAKLGCRAQIHVTLEDPASSPLANYISLAMGVMILISIVTMFVQPVVEHGREDSVSTGEERLWWVFELVLTVIFSLEYVVRLFVCNALGTQTICKFITTPANICDVMAIIPFYVEAAFGGNAEELRLLRVIRLLRLTRIARIGRLAKRSELFPPVAMVLLVIWGIYMKTGLSDSK